MIKLSSTCRVKFSKMANKLGKGYRNPSSPLSSFVMGLDKDLYEAEQIDVKSLGRINYEINKVRNEISSRN